MQKDQFDGIIIGSGQHGLILGSYLAKAGLKILLVERNLNYGGGFMTEEVTLPGFYHNLHSINHWDLLGTPWYRDLELGAKVPYVTPEYEFSQPHSDGTALVFARNLEETVASIARFSKKDADAFREWNKKAEKITRNIFLAERFSEPLPREEREELLSRTPEGREFLDLVGKQPLETLNELFEDERIKVFLLFKLSLFGTVLYDMVMDESPTGSILRAFDIDIGYDLCVGGSWNLARGLMETFIAAGGTFVNQAHVERIVVEGNQATGIELKDGRSFSAGRFVASTVDVHQTFEEMVGEDQLPVEYREKVAAHHYTPWALFGLHLALEEPPIYSSTGYDPNVNLALKNNIGSETLEQLLGVHDAVKENRIPTEIQFGSGAMTVIDPKQAPPGKHTAYAWHVMPYDPEGRPELVEEIKDEFSERILEKWREYAPNLTEDNILGQYAYTPYEYVQHFPNMRGGDIFMGAFTADQVMYNHFGYRTPIEGLYMAGSAAHPGGAISGGAGYITARIIAEDLGIEPWWKPVDVREKLEQLAVAGS
ncbi:MAG: phytoene desaturase family protein [Rubrobacteraceae bacterium]